MVEPPFVIVAFIGKCAYTRRILYWYFFSTPSNKLLMWLHTERSIDSCFDLAKYILARTSFPALPRYSSIGRCLKFRSRVPCLPVTSTIFELIDILMFFGTLIDSSCTKVFIDATVLEQSTTPQYSSELPEPYGRLSQ